MTSNKSGPNSKQPGAAERRLVTVISILCALFGFHFYSVSAQTVTSSPILEPHQYSSQPISQDYYYTRTRKHPNHLRVSEDFKNRYTDDTPLQATINGTRWQYFRGQQAATYDELVFETIDKIFRHRLSAFYIHRYDNDEDKRRSGDQQLVSPERCARDLLYLVDKLHVGAHGQRDLSPELGAFFDSYAQPEAGVLMGNTYWVGAYEQCVKRHIFDLIDAEPRDSKKQLGAKQTSNLDEPQQRVVSFGGRYCVAALKAPQWDQMIERRKQESRNYFRTEHQFGAYSKLFRLQMGICLPDSCDSSSLERHQDEIRLLIGELALGSGAGQRYANYKLADLYCLPDEASPLRQWSGSALTFMLFVGSWSALVLLATLADVCELFQTSAAMNGGGGVDSESTLVRAIGWLSLRANYRKLMHVSDARAAPASADKQAQAAAGAAAPLSNEPNETPPKSGAVREEPTPTTKQNDGSASGVYDVDLRFLNAFKVLVMFWIVNGHIMLLMVQTAKNILESDALLNGLMHFLIGATFGVDLFFTMTGFLTSYLLFNSQHALKMRPGHWLYLTFHRYWRLAPLYVLAFWFSRSVVQMLGSGPLWDYGTSALTFRGLCNQESWWYPLTLTSNLHGLFEECMITSWYISCDMQFWLVSPLYLHLLAHKPLIGWLASLATIGLSSRVRYLAILGEKAARYDELVQPRADIFMRVSHDLPALYTHPHHRIPAYIVGLLAGHYVYMIKSGAWRSSLVAASAAAAKIDQSNIGQERAACSAPLKQQQQTTTNESVPRSATRIRSLLAYTGLTLCLLMAFVSYLLSSFFPSSLLGYSRTIAAYGYAVDHLLMSFGASCLIVSMCFGQWAPLARWLSHPNWTRLSKLNYALLLLQCEAIYFQIFRYDQVPVAGTRELINILFNLLVTLYPVAIGVTLLFELPMANMEKLLLRALAAMARPAKSRQTTRKHTSSSSSAGNRSDETKQDRTTKLKCA